MAWHPSGTAWAAALAFVGSVALGCSGCVLESEQPSAGAPPLSETAAPIVAAPAPAAAPGRLTPVRLPQIAAAPRRLSTPWPPESLRFSPDGEQLLVSGPGQAGLAVVELASGRSRLLTDEPGAGVAMLWAADGDAVLWRGLPARPGGDATLRRLALATGRIDDLAAASDLGFPAQLPGGGLLISGSRSLFQLDAAALQVARRPLALPLPGPPSGPDPGEEAIPAPRPVTAAEGLRPPAASPVQSVAAPADPRTGLVAPGLRRVALGVQGRRVALLQQADGQPVALIDEGHYILRQPLGPDWRSRRRVVSRGDGFFLGEAAPDGRRALVHESRGPAGHEHVVEEPAGPGGVDATMRELVVGHDATWAGPGAVVYAELAHDSLRYTRADLWVIDVASGVRRPLVDAPDALELRPALDPAGRRIAWVDRRDGSLWTAELRWAEVPR